MAGIQVRSQAGAEKALGSCQRASSLSFAATVREGAVGLCNFTCPGELILLYTSECSLDNQAQCVCYSSINEWDKNAPSLQQHFQNCPAF